MIGRRGVSPAIRPPRCGRKTMKTIPIIIGCLAAALAGTAAAGSPPLVRLDAAGLPFGALVTWPNTGSLAGDFTREFDTPSVTMVAGVKGVTLDGNNDWYVGPVAPAAVTGNGSRTIYAWVYNPTDSIEETVVSWGRRGGPAGTHMAFNHGNHGTWGAVAHWDAPDMSWSGRRELYAWTCIAYTWDHRASVASTYFNGSLVEVRAMPGLNTHAVATNGQPLRIILGCENRPDGVRDNGQLPGSLTIGRVEIYDRALSAAEIALAHNADAPAFGRAPVAVAPSVISFSATPEAVFRGDPVTLRWSVAAADEVALAPGGTLPAGTTEMVVTPTRTTTYTLTASNARGSTSRDITVHVQPGEPVAEDLTVTLPMDTPQAIALAASDPNPPPGGLLWTIIDAPLAGTLDGTAPNLIYSPTTGFSGVDRFTFRASDGHAESNLATVTLQVNPPPAPPTAVTSSAATVAAGTAPGAFLAWLRAVDPNFEETHSYELVAGPGDDDNGRFAIIGNQLLAAPAFGIAAGESLSVRVRVTDSNGQSGGQVLVFQGVPAAPPAVVINEIFHDPPGNARTEFIELHNPGPAPVDVGGWAFTQGISYVFPDGTMIPADGYLVVTMDPAAFLAGFGFAAMGPYSGRLSSSGERVELRDAAGRLVDEVDYKAEFPWPVSAGGAGASMELIHPSLDNDLGASWRGSQPREAFPRLSLVPVAATGWMFRPGTGFPPADWRLPAFFPDGTWATGQAPIGFGEVNDLPLNTVVTGMQGHYLSLFARRNFTIAPGELPSALRLRYTIDDGIIIWINGVQVARRNVSGTGDNPSLSTAASTNGAEGLWYDLNLTNAGTYLTEGTNTIAVRVFNRTLTGADLGFDFELVRPAGETILRPTPGARNSVFADTAPPQIRQVRHEPDQPVGGIPATITAKITGPRGVGQVLLHYQVVAPGSFIPARFPRTAAEILANPTGERPVNPAFEDPANWTTIPMRDDGAGGDETAADGTFTAVLPGRPHRTLVRYRITAADPAGVSVRVPYPDDPSLNFAYFVYDGVPDYVAATASVDPAGPGKVWPRALLESLPVYHWLIRPEDMLALQAYESWQQFPNTETDNVLAARRAEDWEGAFVCNGVVYDHVGVRLRGGNSRYGDFEGRYPRGKRHYKFKFNRGRDFQAYDDQGRPYPVKWRSLAFSKMFGNKGGNSWGLPEDIGSTLWETFGVPAPATHWAHFRVIDGAAEAPDQYRGDFWGLVQVVEEYEGSFLDARGMTKGNLYKMSDWIWDAERQRRYQSPDMVRDGSEFNNIRDNLHGGQNAAWLNQFVNYPSWYRYSAVAEAIRHYDVFPYTDPLRHALKNLAWYFEPVGPDPATGVCVFMPFDWDASFGPNWNNGWEHANNALYGHDMSTSDGMPYTNKPEMKRDHRNVLREFRDLVWQPDQVNALLDHRARVIAAFSQADQDRWRNAPADAGTANDDPLAFKLADMKAFCFTGWRAFGGEGVGPTVGAGGRAAYLDAIADGPDAGLLPARPVISYTGPPGFPVNKISFSTTPFTDPQGAHTFAAMAWRVGGVHDPAAPDHDPGGNFILEYRPVWESGALTAWQDTITLPNTALKPGRTYRARVRVMDNSGRWSHWSDPVEFTTTVPDTFADLQANLMITEIMFNPAGPAPPGGSKEDFEFIELQNISKHLTLDLTDVRFTKGADFNFADGAITSLAPGEFVLVVKNRTAFESRYGTGLPVAGSWRATQNLSNSGERIKLSFAAGIGIHDFDFGDRAPWPATPDGTGPSLVLIDPTSAPDHALPENWRASHLPLGSPGLPDSRFAVWLHHHGASDPLAEAAPGLSQAMAYALGADLLDDPRAALPGGGLVPGPSGELFLTLSHRTRLDANEVAWRVEVSDDLTAWRSGPDFVVPAGPLDDNGDGTRTETWRAVLPATAAPHQFIRLAITISPPP